MNLIFDFLFGQYVEYDTIDIVLEIIAVLFGLSSVVFSLKNKTLVFPTGMVSTAIFVYLLLKWSLLGDMMINGYYFVMSIYGWYVWTRKDADSNATAISYTTRKEQGHSAIIFVSTLVFVFIIYKVFDKWNDWTAYVDTVTTAIFFVGMWLMAKRKIENWLYWIVGDLISVPLYFYKGFTFTSLQYFIFTFVAIFGYLAWKKQLPAKGATGGFKQQPGNCIKIVLFGPESTGKTTLAKELAHYFDTPWVPEYMRTYLEKKWENFQEKITIDDLIPIAKGQIASENQETLKANRVLFCDTNLLEIEVYSNYYNNEFCPSEISEAAKLHRYTLYFLTDIDVPWELDKLRDRPDDRQNMFCIFEQQLINNKLPYVKLTGLKKARFDLAVHHINKLLKIE